MLRFEQKVELVDDSLEVIATKMVNDRTTGLTWTVGPRAMTWTDASMWIQDLNSNNMFRSKWRFPSQDEMARIYSYNTMQGLFKVDYRDFIRGGWAEKKTLRDNVFNFNTGEKEFCPRNSDYEYTAFAVTGGK